jgi:hypothetical protein
MVADIAAAVGRLEAPAVEQVGHHAAPVRVIGLLGQCAYKTASVNNHAKKQGCGSGMFIPDHRSKFFPSRIRIEGLSILTQKIVSKLSEI